MPVYVCIYEYTQHGCTQNEILLSDQNKINSCICSSMDGGKGKIVTKSEGEKYQMVSLLYGI